MGPPRPLVIPGTLPVHRNIMNNKVFYQHPNLMRALGMHETVMEVMVNVLGGGESKVKDLSELGSSKLGATEGRHRPLAHPACPRRSASPRW